MWKFKWKCSHSWLNLKSQQDKRLQWQIETQARIHRSEFHLLTSGVFLALIWATWRKEEDNRSFHPAGIFETLQSWTLPNCFSHQDFVFLIKECFDHPRQKTNLCIDLDLWWWLNIEVINIILQHKHFLLRCWLEGEIYYILYFIFYILYFIFYIL